MTGDLCPFCSIDPARVFYAGNLVTGIWDAFPVSDGHALLIPKRHLASWFDATPEERAALAEATAVARDAILQRNVLDHRTTPAGFNIGVNVGETAGQTVLHLHVHVIPRYRGDVPDPRGGVRGVIPHKCNYLPGTKADGAGVVRDAEAHYRRTGPAVTVRDRLIAGGPDDALLRPLIEDLDHAAQVDMAVAFVLESGVDLIGPHLREVLERGGHVRFLTGDYLDATDPRALRRLLDLEGTGSIERRVFESDSESFHPKAYIFLRSSGDGVAYVGSSNLTRPALTHGIEWNYRLTSTDDPAGFAEVTRAFAQLFTHRATRPLAVEWIDAYTRRRQTRIFAPIEVAPEPPRQGPPANQVQTEALEALRRTRAAGNSAGLVVLATGLGKTYLAALDSNQSEYRRVLFVAHREEILAQAMATFRWVRPDARMGSYTGGEKLPDAEVLFASIQTLGRGHHVKAFDRQAFDYIVVDEFHHAAAVTYRRLIDYFQPKFLLGLTATPERTDGGDLLALCQENLVYRCDFIEGIRRGLLCPFHYFGVPDEVDYTNIPWRSSRFDEEELTKALATRARAQNALEQYRSRGGRRTIAFCCSQRHADFMAEFFLNADVRVASVHSGATSDPRAGSLEKLRAGEIDVAFAVDMFNEGLDVPEVDTVMMLRPTESRLLWLQQFGRGLRNAEAKPHLNVIDYIGNHRTFLLKPQTLFQLDPGDRQIERTLSQVLAGDFDLPPGCEVTYDLEAVDIIRGLLRIPRERDDEALKAYYEDFREGQGVRPRAAEVFHDGYKPRSARPAYGSWLRFVRAMGDLTPEHDAALSENAAFLDVLEVRPMTKSYTMLVLLAMLNRDAFPGPMDIDELTREFGAIAQRSAALRNDVGPEIADAAQLRVKIEANPIAAWVGGKGTGGISYFAYQAGRFRFNMPVSTARRSAFQELVREIAEWRLAEYLRRNGVEGAERFVCKVSHANKRPILFLPDRSQHADFPSGWVEVWIDGEPYEANFVKVALNVVRRKGSETNELPGILRRWFGPSAGLPGTDFQVVLERGEEGYKLRPITSGDRQC